MAHDVQGTMSRRAWISGMAGLGIALCLPKASASMSAGGSSATPLARKQRDSGAARPWNRTDEDLNRAFAASATVARSYSLPPPLLKHCMIGEPESPSDVVHDGSLVGIEFSQTANYGRIVVLRILGPVWDRWIRIQFNDVWHFESRVSSLSNTEDLYWIEFFKPEGGYPYVPDNIGELPSHALGCNIYTLGSRSRLTIVAGAVDFASQVIPKQQKPVDFRITDGGEWVAA